MDILTLCPFSVGAVLWEAKPSQWTLTVCVKATVSLVHGGESVLTDAQEPIFEDRTWENEPRSSLFSPDDLVPLKPKIDILLAGHAYAPGGEPVESLIATVRVGDFAKSVHVTGDRVWVKGASGLEPGAPKPFAKMPLRYERALRTAENPVGIDVSAPEAGAPAAPNLEADEGPWGAFGAIAPLWPSRRGRLDEAALRWALGVASAKRVPGSPAPQGLDFRFFNAAPVDQQIDILRLSSVITLENLHPSLPLLETRLPTIRPQVFRVDASTGRVSEVVLRCDTLWIHSDRGVATLSFRGLTDIRSGSEDAVGRIVVAADPSGKRISCERVDRALRDDALDELSADDDDRSRLLEMRHDAVLPRPGLDPTKKLTKRGPRGGEESAEGERSGSLRGSIGDETRRISPDAAVLRNVLPFLSKPGSGPAATPAVTPAVTPAAPPRGSVGDGTIRAPLEAYMKPATPFEATRSGGTLPPPAPEGATRSSGTMPPPAPEGATRSSGTTPLPAPEGATRSSGTMPPPAPEGATRSSGTTPPPAPERATRSSGTTPPPAPERATRSSGTTPPPAPEGAAPAAAAAEPVGEVREDTKPVKPVSPIPKDVLPFRASPGGAPVPVSQPSAVSLHEAPRESIGEQTIRARPNAAASSVMPFTPQGMPGEPARVDVVPGGPMPVGSAKTDALGQAALGGPNMMIPRPALVGPIAVPGQAPFGAEGASGERATGAPADEADPGGANRSIPKPPLLGPIAAENEPAKGEADASARDGGAGGSAMPGEATASMKPAKEASTPAETLKDATLQAAALKDFAKGMGTPPPPAVKSLSGLFARPVPPGKADPVPAPGAVVAPGEKSPLKSALPGVGTPVPVNPVAGQPLPGGPAKPATVPPPKLTAPIAPPGAAKPVTPPVVSKPVTPPVVSKPVAPPVVSKPVAPPVVNKPVAPPVETKAVTSPVASKAVTPPGSRATSVTAPLPAVPALVSAAPDAPGQAPAGPAGPAGPEGALDGGTTPDATAAETSLDSYAAISAEIGLKDADRTKVLRAHRLSEPQWTAIDQRWSEAITKESERGDRSLLGAFDAAYVAAQERLGRRIGVPEYARILVGIERGEVGGVLGQLDLRLSDLMRLQRVWTKRLAEDAALRAEMQRAMDAVRKDRSAG